MNKEIYGRWTSRSGQHLIGYTSKDEIGCPYCGAYDFYIKDYHLDGLADQPVWMILDIECGKCEGEFTFVMERTATDWEEIDWDEEEE